MNRTEYVRHVDTDARYRVSFLIERGRILEFVVQLEVVVEKSWRPVIRFDTAHGFAHCDRYKLDGGVERHEPLPARDFNQALTLAMRTVRADWVELAKPFRERTA